MPERPPLFRPPGRAPRKAWASRSRGATRRVRGRKGQQMRAEVLATEPFCRTCLAAGRHVRAAVVDHIRPLAWGGGEERTNKQALCHRCHDLKSARERAVGGKRASAWPDWIKPSAVPLTIVCGPPCAGKSTYVAEHASAGDLVIEIDAIRRELQPGWQPWTGTFDDALLQRALRYRNHLLGSLARPDAARVAWFVVSAPSADERQWWQDTLGGELVLLDPGIAECQRRAVARGTPLAARGIAEWHRKAREPWARV